MRRPPAVLDAPSNLGLRPPEPGVVPGVYKLAGALRDAGFVAGVGAADAGVVTPPRYRSHWEPGSGSRNADAIASYSTSLADRITRLLDDGHFPIVLGGDCSIVLGSALALRRRGRFGLAYLDGHSDYRHEGNADAIVAVGGEALAVVTGRGDHRLVDLEGFGPYVQAQDIAVVGLRPDDPCREELGDEGILAITGGDWRDGGPDAVNREILTRLTGVGSSGFWIHLDVDILDPEVMPAVDSPDPGGLDFAELELLLAALVGSHEAVGIDVCIFDPDLDPAGEHAKALTRSLVDALGAGLR